MNESTFQEFNKPELDLTEFKQFYTEHKKYVFAMAFSILHDKELSEDVLQEVFIKLYLHLKHTEVTNVKAWLIRVARNTALDMYRKKKREMVGFDNSCFEGIVHHSEDPVEQMILTKYIQSLDQDERQIIVLKDISGMKHREISKILDLPLGTVLWKYRRAIHKLRRNLQ